MMAAVYTPARPSGTRAGQARPLSGAGKRSWRCRRPAGRKASMATTFQIRPVTEEELPAFDYVDQQAFNGRPNSARGHANWLARLELDRTLGAFDGTTLAGVTGIYSFRMRVPGAMAAVAGVSMVAVLPSHRRRGALTGLMRQPAQRHRRAGRGDRRAVRLGVGDLRPVRLRARVLAPVPEAGPRQRRGWPPGTGRPFGAAADRRAAVGARRDGQGLRAGDGRAAGPVRPDRRVVGPADPRPGLRRRPADALRAGRG